MSAEGDNNVTTTNKFQHLSSLVGKVKISLDCLQDDVKKNSSTFLKNVVDTVGNFDIDNVNTPPVIINNIIGSTTIDETAVVEQGVSVRATHINLTKNKERLGNYYEDISDEPIRCSSRRYRNVFLARHSTTQEYRCIKVVSKKRMSKRQFWSEVEIYKTCNHPNILHLYETFEDTKSYYFVVQRLDRPNLYEAIPKMYKNPTDYNEIQVALTIRCILRTLMYCHERGITHSELTYEYILLEPKTKAIRSLYIAGFGQARLHREYKNYQHRVETEKQRASQNTSESFRSSCTSWRSSNATNSTTGSSTSAGLYYSSGDDDDDDNDEEHIEGVQADDLFAAPETRMGDLSTFDKEESDLWSTGVIAYQLLTKRNPFEDKDIWPINYNNPNWKRQHFHDKTSPPYISSLSAEAKDFLQLLLCYKPEDRPTAKVALQHKWFTIAERAGKKVKKSELQHCLTNLQNFHANNTLEKATRMYIVNNLLDSEERAQLDACFRALDKHRNNVITRDELLLALQKSRPRDRVVRVETMLEDIFDRIDIKKTGVIEYEEFLAAAADDSVVLTRENLQATFNAFDKSRTGTINTDDIKRLFNDGRDKKIVWSKDARRLIAKVDTDGDGAINFEEFCRLMHADGIAD